MMRKWLLFVLLVVPVYQGLTAQETEKKEIRPVLFYLGLQPDLEVVPFDELRSAFNVNIFPVTFELAIDRHWALRLHPIWDIQVRPEFPAVFSKAGVEITVPYYFPLKNSEEGHRGFYVAPSVTPAYHRLNQYYAMYVAAEAGYSILLRNSISITLAGKAGLQLQKDPDNPYMRIIPFSAPRISFGFWF